MRFKVLTVATLAVAAVSSQAAEIFIIGTGVINPPLTTDLSIDGGVVVGQSGTTPWRWTAATGLVNLAGGTVSGGEVNISNGGLINGQVLDGNGRTNAAVYNGSSWTMLGVVDGASNSGSDVSSSWDISRDGTTVVGATWRNAGTLQATQWVNGVADWLPKLGDPTKSSRANGVNGDGSVIVGYDIVSGSTWQPVVWRNGVETQLAVTAINSEARGVSSDGNWVIGFADNRGYRWDVNNNALHLGILNGFTGVRAFSISDNGLMAGGFLYTNTVGNRDGFVWTSTDGMVLALGYLSAQVDMSGWTRIANVAVSPDGTAIAGWGTRNGVATSFVATGLTPVPEPATAIALLVGGLSLLGRRSRGA
jgi:uncharacterized membrane protein